jgi:hypothetical protein
MTIPSQDHASIQGSLVLPRRSLASLQLIQVPATDVHIALILRHAVGVLLNVHRAGSRGLLVGSRAVVEVGVHSATRLDVGFGGLLVLSLLLGSGLGGAAAEEAADGVADGGTDCDTARSC